MHFLLFVLGSCIGSFFGVVAERLPLKGSIVTPASHCCNCRHRLAWYELIPIVSIVIQRFRCRQCGVKLPGYHLWSEVACGVLFVSVLNGPLVEERLLLLFWLLSAFVLSLTDVLYYLVAPKILYPTALILWLWQFQLGHHFRWQQFVVFIVLSLMFIMVCPEKMGLGDLVLLAVWLPWLTLYQLIWLIFIASFSGLLTLLVIRYLLKQPLIELPFVPHLTFGLYWVLVWLPALS